MTKLSIITINRNNAAGLRRTIESVVSQTYTDFEYIVIDGASTDESVDVIKEYADRITYWISEPDKGIYNAMNKGILKAKGEYLLFLNSGDWLVDEQKIQIMVNNLNNEDIIITNIYLVENKKIENNKFIGINSNESIRDSLNSLDLIYGVFPHNATFFKKVLFEKNGLYDESLKIVSDWKFMIKSILFNNATTKIFRNEFIVNFDVNGVSATERDLYNKERRSVLNEFFTSTILKDYEEYYQLYLYNESIKKRYEDYMALRKNKVFLVFIRFFLWLIRKGRKYNQIKRRY
jgi:glycosyltransferase involved in cell wall biosynthesis